MLHDQGPRNIPEERSNRTKFRVTPPTSIERPNSFLRDRWSLNLHVYVALHVGFLQLCYSNVLMFMRCGGPVRRAGGQAT